MVVVTTAMHLTNAVHVGRLQKVPHVQDAGLQDTAIENAKESTGRTTKKIVLD